MEYSTRCFSLVTSFKEFSVDTTLGNTTAVLPKHVQKHATLKP